MRIDLKRQKQGKIIMNIKIREYKTQDAKDAIEIWNTVVQDGIAFPQEECLTEKSGDGFFKSQTFTGIAFDEETSEIVGLYILHPNNVGRCGHICNASYAVKKEVRGQHIGEKLITHCKEQAHKQGYRILQFNAVVATNYSALHLYEKLGFKRLGIIKGGFRMDDGQYEDIIPHWCEV